MARVVIAIHSLVLGGAERVALQWANWLLEAGHEVLLLTRARDSDLGCGVEARRAEFFTLPVGLPRVCEQALPPPFRRMGALAFPIRIINLRRWLRRKEPDLIIAMTTKPAIKVLLASWKLRSTAVVVAERVHPGAMPLGPFWRLMRWLTYSRASLLLTQTADIAAWFSVRGYTMDKAVLPNALQWPMPVEQPLVPPDKLLDPGVPVILAAGTKPYQKGFDLLVQAFELARRSCPGWQLVIAGMSRAEWPQHWPWPVGDAAPLLLGRVGNIADWYARADLFVLSSRYEGFPNVLLEAMASGTACLAVDCPSGPGELIDHGRNGWLLPFVKEPSAMLTEMASALVQLMIHRNLRQEFSAAALDVHTRFSVKRIRRGLLGHIEQLLADP